MLEKLRSPSKQIVEIIAKPFTFFSPNFLTIVGFLLSLVSVYFFISGKNVLGGVALVLTFFDSIDGAVARLTGRVSLFGEVLDASIDRVTDALIIFSIAKGGFVAWDLAFLVLIGFYMVSYVRARAGEAAAKKVKFNIGIAERGDRIIILALASIFYIDEINIPFIENTKNLLEVTFWILLVLTYQTAVYRLLSANKHFKKMKDGKS